MLFSNSDLPENSDPISSFSYHLENPPASLKGLREHYRPEQLGLLEKLNRRDEPHLPRLQVLVVPNRWDLPELDYSPMPKRYRWAEPHRKALIVYLPGQVFGAYEWGQLVRWGPVSSGGVDRATPQGLFHLNWRSTGRRSTVNPAWYMPWYFNFENREGLSLHAYTLPGYPASHSCIRLLERDARWLYDWGEPWELGERLWEVRQYGTPLLILGQYDFHHPAPWHALDWWARGVQLPADPVFIFDAE